MAGEMLFKCAVCAPATDHGSAPAGARRDKRWRTVDIHCHCMVPAANEYVLKATGIAGGGTDTNASARQRPHKIDHAGRGDRFSKSCRPRDALADMNRLGIDVSGFAVSRAFHLCCAARVAREARGQPSAVLVSKASDRLMGMGTVPLGLRYGGRTGAYGEDGSFTASSSANVRRRSAARRPLTFLGSRAWRADLLSVGIQCLRERSYFGRSAPLESRGRASIFDGYLERFEPQSLHRAWRLYPATGAFRSR